jgi:hypothetical protein
MSNSPGMDPVLPAFISDTFQHYFTTIQFITRLSSLNVDIHHAYVDVFAHLPTLDAYILCWSSLGSRFANRVFYAAKHAHFRPRRPDDGVVLMDLSEAQRQSPAPHDLALTLDNPAFRKVAYVPITSSSGAHAGMIRVIGGEKAIADMPCVSDQADSRTHVSDLSPDLIEADLLPHILGRWAGTFFHGAGDGVVDVLLTSFCSYLSSCHNMYFTRQFETDEALFLRSTSSETAAILRDAYDSLSNPTHMFSIAMRYGNSEVLREFPEALTDSLRPNVKTWQPDDLYRRLVALLKAECVSLFSIPLKVDDCVLGVFQVMARRDEARFSEAARFARSCISEMGRTIDKTSTAAAITYVRDQTFFRSQVLDQGDYDTLGLSIVNHIVKILIPFATAYTGQLYAPPFATTDESTEVPKASMEVLRERLPDAVRAGELTLLYDRARMEGGASYGFLVLPVTAWKRYAYFIYAPLDALTGRSLRAALEELQLVMMLSYRAASSALASERATSEMQTILRLWNNIHKLKNMTAKFGLVYTGIQMTATHGTLQDVKRRIDVAISNLDADVEGWKQLCDHILDKTAYRKTETVQVIRSLYSAYQDAASQYPKYTGVVEHRCISGDTRVVITTLQLELHTVLVELYTNVLKHFDRTKPGTVFSAVNVVRKTKQVQIHIWDDVYEHGALQLLQRALDDENSTFGQWLQKTVVMFLHGSLWCSEAPLGKNPMVTLQLPIQRP